MSLMDLKELNWLLQEKYNLIDAVDQPHLWPAEAAEDLKRLSQGEPLAYVIGFIPFLGSRIDLRFRPLVPRSETEYWVQVLLKQAAFKKKTIKALDLFTGSGCIGLSLLRHWPEARVDFADNNLSCLEQVEYNLALNKINSRRARLIHSDLFTGIQDKYDLILANPPYISSSRFEHLPRSVRDYEPKEALIVGEEGLALIRRFLDQVSDYLNPWGQFWLEFDPAQKESIQPLISSSFQADFGRDQYGLWRFVVGHFNFD